ncbi:MAG: hypothetical protein O2794_01790 [bacterium]|nr:hypothetical protein [bacterium]
MHTHTHGSGFTTVELLVVIALLMIMGAATLPIYGNFQVRSQINEGRNQVIQALRLARERSVNRLGNSPHGVYLDLQAEGLDQYILYKGTSFALSDVDDRLTMKLDKPLSFIVNLSGTGDARDINFTRGTGIPNKTGTIIIADSADERRVININSRGAIEENRL